MSKPKISVKDGNVALLVGTRKGGFLLRSSHNREKWKLEGPFLLGAIVHNMILDPRDGHTLLMAASTGHLGPTIFRSTDQGRTWKEAARPPAFPKVEPEGTGEAINHTFSLWPGHVDEPGVFYAGTSPVGLFRSEDSGETWNGVAGFNENPMRRTWIGPAEFAAPGGGGLHSLQIDPRDPAHMYMGCSMGGVFETLDQGKSWQPLNKGCEADFLPDPEADFGHDPHTLRIHPLYPDVLYQQNHCGIYRMDREDGYWVRIGSNMPADVGDIGFPIVLDPRDPQRVWVFPMDGTEIWPRTSPKGKPAVYVSTNGGKNWESLRKGLPARHGYFTVKRHAMNADRQAPLGIYFGTSAGQVWGSVDEGKRWRKLVDYLPEIYSIEPVVFAA